MVTQPDVSFRRQFEELVETFLGRSLFLSMWLPERVNLTIASAFLAAFEPLVAGFPALIALGAARCDDEDARAVLATNLYQECGSGDVRRTHYAIYRRFLESAHVPAGGGGRELAAEWRRGLYSYLGSATPTQALAALAAGEFLAQPVLHRVFSVVAPLFPGADVEYFTHHLALETEHMDEIGSLIERRAQTEGSPEGAVDGFRAGLAIWAEYFDGLARHLFGGVGTGSTASVGWAAS